MTDNNRDSSVKLFFSLISESSYVNRHSLRIAWSKTQELASEPPPEIQYTSSGKSQHFTMISVSTPEPKQSEAFIATTALFLLFGSSAKEDKVFLRLPPTWRDLWTELSDAKKAKADEEDRETIRKFRDMVREKRDQEEEDGVLIQGAFRNRQVARATEAGDESGTEKTSRALLTPEAYQHIWWEKCSTQSYRFMLVSVFYSSIEKHSANFCTAISYATPHVGVPRKGS